MKKYDNEKSQNWAFMEAIGLGISFLAALTGVALIIYVATVIGQGLR